MEKKTSTIALNSNNRINGTCDNFTVNFLPPLHRVSRWAIKRLAIPKTFYTVNENTDRLTFSVNAAQKTGTLPHGTYTGDELASAIETALTTAYSGTLTWTVTWSSITRKFTITATNAELGPPLTLLWYFSTDKNLWQFLGFNGESDTGMNIPAGPSVTSITSVNAVNINFYPGLILRSTYLSGRNPDPNFHSQATGGDMRYSSFITFIPYTVDHDEEMVHYEPNELHWNETDGSTIAYMDFALDFSWYPATATYPQTQVSSGFTLNNPVSGWELELFIEN